MYTAVLTGIVGHDRIVDHSEDLGSNLQQEMTCGLTCVADDQAWSNVQFCMVKACAALTEALRYVEPHFLVAAREL